MIRKCGSHPFPLLTERKHCNRGGRRWALLRRRLKITGIFKAAEESQGRQRLDSLPPDRSSLLPRKSAPPLPRLTPFHFYANPSMLPPPHEGHGPVRTHSWTERLSALRPGFSKQTAPANSEQHVHMHPATRPTCQASPSCRCRFPYRGRRENSHRLFCHDLNQFSVSTVIYGPHRCASW